MHINDNTNGLFFCYFNNSISETQRNFDFYLRRMFFDECFCFSICAWIVFIFFLLLGFCFRLRPLFVFFFRSQFVFVRFGSMNFIGSIYFFTSLARSSNSFGFTLDENTETLVCSVVVLVYCRRTEPQRMLMTTDRRALFENQKQHTRREEKNCCF